MSMRHPARAHALLALLLLGVLGFAGAHAGVRPEPVPASQSLPGSPLPSAAVTRTFDVSADAFIAGAFPDRNAGASDRLVLGGDPANATAYRSLLDFNLSLIPATARIVNATLRAYALQAPPGRSVAAHALRAPWLEGTGVPYRYRQNVTVWETAGVARVREPVDLTVVVAIPLSTFVKADFRVYDETGREVPSQVYGATFAGANVTRVHVVFGASVAARGTRTFTLDYGALVPEVPTFRSRSLGNLLWSYPVGSNYAPLTAVDLDGDGKLEVVVASVNGTISALRWDGTGNATLLWSHTAADAVEAFATAVDLDGDGRLEVVYATTGSLDAKVYALRWNGTPYWNSSAFPGRAVYAPIAISDVDGDGIKELFFGSSDGNLYRLNGNNGTVRWRYTLGGGAWGYGAAVGNLTGGPEPEIVFTASTGDFYALRVNGSLAWVTSPGGKSTIVTPSLGDFGTPGTLDVVAGDTSVSGSEFAFQGTDGLLIWAHNTLSDQYGGQVLVDLYGDGSLETVFAMSRKNAVGALDSLGNELWTVTTGGSVYGLPAVADVNLDGVPEVLIGSFDQNLYVVNATGAVLRRFPTSDVVSATPIVADLDGDGTMEIVFASRSAVYAYSTGSLGHDFRTGSYNYNLTGRFLDGNSPDGAPLLTAGLGPLENVTGTGVTWRSRDGGFLWASPGSDYEGLPAATATTGAGGWLSWNVTDLVQSWANGSLPNAGVLLKAADESLSGLTILGSREGGPTQAEALVVTYFENTGPKILVPVPDQTVAEDSPMWSLNLKGYAADPDNAVSELRWDLGGVDHSLYEYFGGNVTGNDVLRFQPKPNAYGNDRATLFLFDPQGHFAYQPLWINITPVDDAPVFTPPPIFYVKYGQPYTFDFTPYISDVDTPLGNLTLGSDDAVRASVSGMRVTFAYPVGYPDQWAFVVLSVDDGQLTTSQSVAIRLTTDAPPQLTSPLPDVTVREKQTVRDVFDLDDHFMDPDGDPLAFSSATVAGLGVTIQSNHSVDIKALGNFYGNASVTFRAKDPTGAFAEDTILVTVLPVNDPPVIGDFPPFVVHYDAPYAFDLAPHLEDPDTPLSEITIATSLSPFITVNATVLHMLFPRTVGPLTVPYTLPLTIYANDGTNTTSRTTTVTVGNDYPPQLRPGVQLPDEVFVEDTRLVDAFNLDDYFMDQDSSTIFYWSGPQNIFVTIHSNHTVDFNATLNWNGEESATFRASDSEGAYAEDTIRVTVLPANDPPFFHDLPDVVSDGGTFVLDLADRIGDVDTNASLLSLKSSDPYVKVEGFVLVFDYPSDVRQDVVNLTLSDGQATTYADIHVRIQPFDPILYSLPAILAAIAILGAVLAIRVVRTQIEHAFLIYRDGILLFHMSPGLAEDKDPDLIASMFTAIENFMDESFRSMGVGQLKGLELADHRVALVRGTDASLVVLYRGAAAGHVEKRAREAIQDIERRYGHILKDWNGDMGLIKGAQVSLERLFPARALRRMQDAAAASGDATVEADS
ncbi:MAG: DNRLRE domain-containing protein [Thermoplasmata archaeon]